MSSLPSLFGSQSSVLYPDPREKRTKEAYNPGELSGHNGIKMRRMSHGCVPGAKVQQGAAC